METPSEKLGRLGRGANGEVWLVRQQKELRALKILPLKDTSEAELNQEIKIGKQLPPNEHIVQAFPHEISKGELHLYMEYVRGVNLRDHIAKAGNLSVDEALNLFTQLMIGLEHAHNHDVGHFDIKPANLMIGDDGILKIADWGTAQILGTLDHRSNVAGTYAYLPPEYFQTPPRVGRSADLWASGVVLYEMLTGKRPFSVIDRAQRNNLNNPFAWKPVIDAGIYTPLTDLLKDDRAEKLEILIALCLSPEENRFAKPSEIILYLEENGLYDTSPQTISVLVESITLEIEKNEIKIKKDQIIPLDNSKKDKNKKGDSAKRPQRRLLMTVVLALLASGLGMVSRFITNMLQENAASEARRGETPQPVSSPDQVSPEPSATPSKPEGASSTEGSDSTPLADASASPSPNTEKPRTETGASVALVPKVQSSPESTAEPTEEPTIAPTAKPVVSPKPTAPPSTPRPAPRPTPVPKVKVMVCNLHPNLRAGQNCEPEAKLFPEDQQPQGVCNRPKDYYTLEVNNDLTDRWFINANIRTKDDDIGISNGIYIEDKEKGIDKVRRFSFPALFKVVYVDRYKLKIASIPGKGVPSETLNGGGSLPGGRKRANTIRRGNMTITFYYNEDKNCQISIEFVPEFGNSEYDDIIEREKFIDLDATRFRIVEHSHGDNR